MKAKKTKYEIYNHVFYLEKDEGKWIWWGYTDVPRVYTSKEYRKRTEALKSLKKCLEKKGLPAKGVR